jgi:hypothetical protein
MYSHNSVDIKNYFKSNKNLYELHDFLVDLVKRSETNLNLDQIYLLNNTIPSISIKKINNNNYGNFLNDLFLLNNKNKLNKKANYDILYLIIKYKIILYIIKNNLNKLDKYILFINKYNFGLESKSNVILSSTPLPSPAPVLPLPLPTPAPLPLPAPAPTPALLPLPAPAPTPAPALPVPAPAPAPLPLPLPAPAPAPTPAPALPVPAPAPTPAPAKTEPAPAPTPPPA